MCVDSVCVCVDRSIDTRIAPLLSLNEVAERLPLRLDDVHGSTGLEFAAQRRGFYDLSFTYIDYEQVYMMYMLIYAA